MRVLAGLSALLLGTAVIAKPHPAPNFETSTTSVHVDRHREALDNGEVIVRVERTSDLFSDATASEDAKLLLEKNTHVALRIQLDPNSGSVNVNDQPISITSEEPKYTLIQADTFTLPVSHKSPVADADMMLSLAGQMSPGIIAIQVKVASEPFSQAMEMVSIDDNGDVKPTVEKISIRKVSLWIRVTEVEGQQVPHTTTTFTPILQLIVEGSGDKVKKIATLSVDGRPPVNGVHHPGPVMGMGLPPLPHHEQHHGHKHAEHEEGRFKHAHAQDDARPFRPHRHHRRPPGFFAWLKSFFGFAPSHAGRPPFHGQNMKRPCPAHLEKLREGIVDTDGEESREQRPHKVHNKDKDGKIKLPSHRFMAENPFSGDFDDDEGFEGVAVPIDPEHIGVFDEKLHAHGRDRPRSHRHHRPGPCARFVHRMAIGFVYGMALLGTIFMNPITIVIVLGLLCAGAVVVHGARRLAMLRAQEGSIKLGENDESEETAEKVPFMGEKEREVYLDQVVIDDGKTDLPRYEA